MCGKPSNDNKPRPVLLLVAVNNPHFDEIPKSDPIQKSVKILLELDLTAMAGCRTCWS